MKLKFLLSTVLVLTTMLAACAPQAAPTKKASVPPAISPVTKPTTMPEATATTASKSSSTTSTKPTAAPTKSTLSATPTTAAPGSSTAVTPTVGPALFNDITMDNQSVSNGIVMVSMVDSLQPGWVAIFTDDNGQPGKVLGYVAVPKGTSEDIKVTLNTKDVPSKMIAMLLTDEGQIGTFEYPGADQPVRNANVNENVLAIFNRVSQ